MSVHVRACARPHSRPPPRAGKWHLGTTRGYHPIDRGFDSYVGLPYSLDMGCAAQPSIVIGPYVDANRSSCPACAPHAPCPADRSCLRAAGCADASLGLPLYHNRTIVQQPADLDALRCRGAALHMRWGGCAASPCACVRARACA